jgi:hypothetical protein
MLEEGWMPSTDWNIMIMLRSDVSTTCLFDLYLLTPEKILLPNSDFTLTNSDGQRLLPSKLEIQCTELIVS